MATIAVEGMRFYAHHGFYEEERIIGNNFVVDVYVETNPKGHKKAVAQDDLYKTINYETIYLVVQKVMRVETKLLETLADKIVYNIKQQFGGVKEMKVRVKKENPPLGGKVDCSYVETGHTFVQRCSRCKKDMLCYGDRTCWCQEPNLYPKTQEAIASQWSGCLCKECLAFFVG